MLRTKTLVVVVFAIILFSCSKRESEPSSSLAPLQMATRSGPLPKIADIKRQYRTSTPTSPVYNTSASNVTMGLGKPYRTEDFGGGNRVYYYQANDEFGNPCFAKLLFFSACADKNAENLDCYKLTEVLQVARVD